MPQTFSPGGRRSFALKLAGAAAAAAALAFAAPGHAAVTATYYVDCAAGSDANSGTSATSAWRSLSPVRSRTFSAGNVINLKRGCSWDGGLTVRGNGTADSPITYTAYGSGDAPVIRNSTGGMYAAAVDVTGDQNVIDGLLVRDAVESGVLVRTGADGNVVRTSRRRPSGSASWPMGSTT